MLIFCILLICLFQNIGARSLLRLSTLQDSKLTSSDIIYSTLGLFRMSLFQTTCSLKIEIFLRDQYQVRGYAPNSHLDFSCEYLVLGQGLLQTPNGINLLKIDSSQIASIKETTLTIDDLGIIRIIGTTEFSFSSIFGWEARITEFREPNNEIFATSDISITQSDSLLFRRNKRGWGFSAIKGEIKIFMLNDPSKIIRYKYENFKVSYGRIFDINNISPPIANISGLYLLPRCGYIRELNFKAPFVFQVDDFWPQLRVLDQGGYQLLSFRYPNLECLKDLNYLSLIDNGGCVAWFCPPQTFQHEGQCIARCPFPYYHQIKANKRNRCVLVCEQGSKVQQNGFRICTCGSAWQKPECSNGAKVYPLGCTCNNKTYYFPNIGCTAFCPESYFAYQETGLCVSCPPNCRYCKKGVGSEAYINFLSCLQCNFGYDLLQGVCKKKCQGPFYLDSQLAPKNIERCIVCEVQHCVLCDVNNGKICEGCIEPYSLINGSCVENCPATHVLQLKKKQSEFYFEPDTFFICKEPRICPQRSQLQVTTCETSCTFIQRLCWKRCDPSQFYNNQSSCFCRKSEVNRYDPESLKNYGFIRNCLSSLENTQCIYKRYLDQMTGECLACPFGCLTCDTDQNGAFQCTSCAPSYFLFLRKDQGHYCQIDTPMNFCRQIEHERVYDPQNKICRYKNPEILQRTKKVNRTLCYSKEPNCQICFIESSKRCSFCKDGYFLYSGHCVKKCPAETFLYHRVCLVIKTQNVEASQLDLNNCQVPEIVSYHHLIPVNIKTQSIQGYYYLLAQDQISGKNIRRRDPMARPFTYFYLTNFKQNKEISYTRQGFYDEGLAICKKCMPYYGIDIFTKNCKPCHQFNICKRCSDSSRAFCEQCHEDYFLDTKSGTCFQKHDKDKNCKKGEYRLSNFKCSTLCKGFYYPNSDSIVNCTHQCPYEIKRLPSSPNILTCLKSVQSLSNGSFIEKSKVYIAASKFSLPLGYGILVLMPINSSFSFTEQTESKFAKQIFVCKYRQQIYQGQRSCLLTQERRLLQSASGERVISELSFTKNKIIVGFSDKLPQFIRLGLVPHLTTPQPPYISNSDFYFTPETASYHELINTGLTFYGDMYIFILFIVTIIFMSDNITYKTDNLFILCQTLPLFLYSLNLTETVSKDNYRFYYSFKWTIGHIFGAPHYLTIINQHGLPYIQNAPNNAHHLINIDNNVLRNTYIFLSVLGALGIIFAIIGLIMRRAIAENTQNQNRKVYLEIDADHRTKLWNFFIFMFELSALPIFYFSLSSIMNPEWTSSQGIVRTISFIISIILMLLFVCYTIFRVVSNQISSIYMFKRIYLAVILAFIQGNSLIMLYALAGQFLFTLFRLQLEVLQFRSPARQFKQRFALIIIEQILIALVYIFLGIVDLPSYSTQGVTVIIAWGVINIMMVAILAQFIVYVIRSLRKQEQIPENEKQSYIQRIRKVWDYSILSQTEPSKREIEQ